jgi:hypothetical protein
MPPEDQSAGFAGQAAETPPERIERHIRELKAGPVFSPGEPSSRWAELSEARKLEQLDRLDWQGLPPLERLSVIEAEVDLTRVSPAIQRLYLGEVREQALQAIHGGQIPSLTAAILADPHAFLPESRASPEALAADRGAGSGVYQVWHDAGWPERAGLNARFGVETPFPAGYIHVADVEADNLGQAVALTGGAGYLPGPGGDVSWEPWEMNPGVRAFAPLPQTRDTAAGDVVVDPQGRAHRYDGLGFRAIPAEDRPLPTPADDGRPGPHAPGPERGMGRGR